MAITVDLGCNVVSGVGSVTGDGVDGTPVDVVMTYPTPSDIGLGNVDNTSDASKPISTATQTALDSKIESDDYATSTVGGTLKARLDGTTLYLTNNGTDA